MTEPLPSYAGPSRSVWAYLREELPTAEPDVIAAATTALLRFLNDNTTDMCEATR